MTESAPSPPGVADSAEAVQAPDNPSPRVASPGPQTPSKRLTDGERADLERHEMTVTTGLDDFVATGAALLDISDRRLYREQYSTFREYCETKWQMSARRCYQLCQHAEVLKSLPQNVNHGSQINERQSRELAKVEPAKRAEVLKRAASSAPNGKPTARAIRAVVQRTKPVQEPQAPAPPIAPATVDDQWRRAIGGTVPAIAPATGEPGPREYGLAQFEKDVASLTALIPEDGDLARYALVLRVEAAKLAETARNRRLALACTT